MTRPTRVALAFLDILGFLATLAVPVVVHADPRWWWWHDRTIAPGAMPQTAPDVAFARGETSGGPGAIFVVWEQTNSRGVTDVLLDASFDGGCSFCGPVTWAASSTPPPESSTGPQIAVGFTDAASYSIQVVFVRSGQVYVAFDSSLASAGVTCARFRRLATPTPRKLSQRPGVVDSRPRIAGVAERGTIGHLHAHAVWVSEGNRLQYDHDLTGTGAGWGGGYKDLGDVTVFGEPGTMPDITSDDLPVDPETAPTLVFLDSIGAVHMARSIDSGLTWPTPSLVVNPTKGQCAPAADTSAGGPFFSAANAWSGCVWQSAPNSASMILDAALWTSPLTRNPDFDPSVGDVLVSAPPDRQGVEPALAIAPSMGSAAGPGLTSLYAMWTNLVARPPAELVARAGVLDANAPPYRDLDRPAIAAVRTGVTRLDAHFTWGADLLALTYHLNKIIVKSDVPEPFSKRSDVSNGRGVAKCDVAAPDCIVGNAVSDSDKLVFYQAYSACGLLGADEGPF